MIEVDRYACDNVVKCLVGNKTDLAVTRVRARHTDTQSTRNSPHTTTRLRRHLVQVVTVEEAREVAASLNVSYFETSAKTGTLSRSATPLFAHRSTHYGACVCGGPTAGEGVDEAFLAAVRQVLEAQGTEPKAPGVSLRASAPPKKKGCSV
jgi:GTPase SAR1 family protein